MRLKTRFIILGVIFSIFFISFKIIEPELEGYQDSKKAPVDWENNDGDVHSTSKGAFNDKKVKYLVDKFVKKYAVDWNMTVSGSLWNVPVQWINAREIHPEAAPEIG